MNRSDRGIIRTGIKDSVVVFRSRFVAFFASFRKVVTEGVAEVIQVRGRGEEELNGDEAERRQLRVCAVTVGETTGFQCVLHEFEDDNRKR